MSTPSFSALFGQYEYVVKQTSTRGHLDVFIFETMDVNQQGDTTF